MIYYLLIDSGSGLPITQFAWNEDSGSITGSFLTPSGTYLELVSSGTIAAYTSSAPISLLTVGDFAGEFTGSFSGSFNGIYTGVFNGNTLGTSSYALQAGFANSKTIQIFTTSSTWTKPSWARTVKVILVGGGGGGGGSYGWGYGAVTGGGGGAGGSLVIGEFDASQLPTSSISITVGSGGPGGVSADIGGSNGGTSYFGNYLFAPGGQGGTGGKFVPVLGIEDYVDGGYATPTTAFTSTGGGPGGRGSIDGYRDTGNNMLPVIVETVAPSLPIHPIYLELNWNGTQNIPAAIAPTGGGGGTGYNGDDNFSNDTWGGSLKVNSYMGGADQFPLIYGLVGRTWGIETDDKYYPAFNTSIGFGATGGKSSGSIEPTIARQYGGGGGGAFGGGGSPGTPMDPYQFKDNYGSQGASGVVVIISEA